MNVALVTIGIILLAAAVIGGGLKAAGYEIPVIKSRFAQVGLGLVGSIALLLGVFADKISQSSANPPVPTTATSQPPQSAPVTSSSTTPPPMSESSPEATDSVFWSGSISLEEYGDLYPDKLRDLDSKPPMIDEDEGDIGAGDIENSSATYAYLVSKSGSSSVALWAGSGAPSHAQCRESAVASGTDTVEMKLGNYACVRTSHGRTALLQITKLVGDLSLDAYVTVWDDGDF